jgi:integrase/recombinase XerD
MSKEAGVMVTQGRYPVRPSGPLAEWVHPFRDELIRQGFTARTAQDHAYVLAHLSGWLQREGLDPVEFDAEGIAAFARARESSGYRRWRSVASLRLMLTFLRGRGLVPVEEPRRRGPVDEVLERYGLWLRRERRLGETTVDMRLLWAHRFLVGRVVDGVVALERLGPEAVTAFVLGMAGRYSTGSMKHATSGLRSLLRFLFAAGDVDSDLSSVVPSVAGWRSAGLPVGAGEDTVAALLASCDRSTAVGLRDLAVLLLMTRLGLRAVEVARLRLEDVDWRGGEMVVRGKGGRVDRMPLPGDVGAALAGYLRHGRRRSRCREVFVRAIGPDAPMARHSMVMVPRRVSQRAGVPVVGAHQLRHRAACRVLAGGGSLAEVAELLRHNDLATTAIYAKVDLAALATVVRPWPTEDRDAGTA